MRLFIAINFNTETRMQLLALRDELRIRSRRGSFTVPENLHLTLVFLGECDEAQTSSVKKVMSTINFEPFPICIGPVFLKHIQILPLLSGMTFPPANPS
jgi:2'-5' RNA ligase